MGCDIRQTPLTLRSLRTWLPGGLLAVAVLVVASVPLATPPLNDAENGGRVPFAELAHSISYLAAAPLFGVWDTLSLLTLSQHYAVLATLAALYLLLRVRAPKGARSLHRGVAVEAVRAAGSLACLFGFYAAGLLLPRPMVGLRVTDPDLVTIDFHSHTNNSHDGWSLFTAPRNRAWHEAGGFDAAYVTDHYTWAGFDDARPANPDRVGERTTLLSGAEIRIHRRPTNVLGDRRRYQFALDSDSVQMEADSLAARYERGGQRPTLLYTMPGELGFVVPFTDEQPFGVIGIELNDGSPRGLEQVKAERPEILALADSADLAIIAASNLHGWGRTVAAWSIMRIPGWQEMSPEGLGDVIEAELHSKRRAAVSVVERSLPYHGGSRTLLALTLPWLVWEHFRMLGTAERASWLFWLGLLGVVRASRLRRGRGRHSLEATPSAAARRGR